VLWHVNLSASGQWMGVCEPLGLTEEGISLDDLFRNIELSMQRLIERRTLSGELDSYLSERGWRGLLTPGRPQQGPAQYRIVVHRGYTKR
jgi:hypothetical protein